MSGQEPYEYNQNPPPPEDELFELRIPEIPFTQHKDEDSLENNCDARSDKDDLNNLLGQDYEKNNNHILNEINIVDNPDFKTEPKREDEILNEAENILSERNNEGRFETVLKELISKFQSLWSDRLVKLVSLVMGIKGSNMKELSYFVRAVIFLKELWTKLGEVEKIGKYHSLLGEILKITHPIYSIKLNEEYAQVLDIYVNELDFYEEGMDIEPSEQDNPFSSLNSGRRFGFNSEQVEVLESMLNENYLSQGENSSSKTDEFYRFVHRNFFAKCFRKSVENLNVNVLLISRAPDADAREECLVNNQEGIYIEDFSPLDKREIEDYATAIAEIATDNPKYSEKYIFRLVDWLLAENSQMEKKIIGFKVLGELVGLAKSRQMFATCLINWLTDHQILEKFLRESTHSRILQHLSPILHFLYENGVLPNNYLIQLMKLSLHSEDLFKIVQTMLSWLKIEHLEQAYDMLSLHKQREKEPTSLLSQFVNALVSSPILLGNNSRKRKNIMIQDNRRELDGETEGEAQQLSEKAEFLVKRLMKYLIERVIADQQLFMPILLRHITAHMKLLKPQLQKEIISLLKSNSPAGVWILEQCLKIETSHDQGQGQGKYELIGRLSSEGVYQLILALIARHRYSRSVIDKSLSVVILLCRFHKPLERGAAEFLWKVLGLTASDEREREQFFVFLKEIVRFEGAVSQQSVNFIFFELLMGLCADWFSPRVYDCLEMLFLRLNEDCKLISFEKDHYKIIQPPLIGTDKLWYIYFNSPDLKVTKKCKDFIFKLIMNSPEKKQQLYQQSLANITKYLEASLQLSGQWENKQQVLILRGFQISEKLLLERERIEETTKYNTINLKIIDTTPNSFQKCKIHQLSEKLTLLDLRSYISDNLNPSRRFDEIQLMNKGKVLVGENQTLKQMKLQNNETITVALINTDIEPLSQIQKDEIKKEQLEQLNNLFGEEFSTEFLTYIVQKFEGDSIENIANIMFDQGRIEQIKEEYERSKEEAEEDLYIIEMKEEPKKFGEMLVETMANTQLLLRCLMISHNKKGGWKFLKELPINKEYNKLVQEHIQTGDWNALFQNKTHEQSKYVAYILTNIIRQSSLQSEVIFNEKHLRTFLLEWIYEVVENSIQKLEDYENIFKLLLISLNCPLFSELQTFSAAKKSSNEQENLFQKLGNVMQIQSESRAYISPSICCKLIDALSVYNISEKMTLTIIKLYIYQLYYYYHEESSFSILYNHQLPILLLRYGKPIYFAIVATALRLQFNSKMKSTFDLSTFTLSLLESFIKSKEVKELNYHYAAYFACVEELFDLTPVYNSINELNALSAVLHHLKDNITHLLEEEIIGFIRISLKLLNRHLRTEHGERRNDELREFANWLFNHYLFGIQAALPFFKSKGVRKIAYQLIKGLCAYHHINKHIAISVKKLMNHCKGLEKEEGEFRTTEFIGMKNLGATCYINSLLQQLYHTVFPKLLLDEDTSQDYHEIKLLQLKKIFANLYIGVKSPVATNKYVETVKINGEQIRPLVQQDVNEYFASLMHEIEQEVGNKATNSIMSGSFCHEIRGLQEGSEVKNVQETYLTLMIEMRGKKNLSEALSALSKQHILEGDNMYYSEVLHKKIRASSKTYLDKLPPLLVITLKRFNWNFETMTRHKINDYFEFPMELELSRYAIPGKKEVDHYYEYKLCGILIHSGSAESGHYYSFIKVGEKWLEFNDRRVSEWDIQNNLKNECFGGNQERNRNAYMLFYERVESQTHGAGLHLLAEQNRLIKTIKNENESFIKNRLIYDSGYIDFIKELSRLEGNSSLLQVLDGLKIYRDAYEGNTHIDVDNLLGKGVTSSPKAVENNPDLNRKMEQIINYYSGFGAPGDDNQLSLLAPNEKGTENDKL